MSVDLLPATPQDAAELVELGMAAFTNDKLANALFSLRIATPEDLADYRAWRQKHMQARMSGPGKHWFKAVDDSTGSIVGLIGLNDTQVHHIAVTETTPRPLPKYMNAKAGEESRAMREQARNLCMGERQDYWSVQSMAVHPDYQGRGIGQRLLQRALDEVDEDGKDVYLEATEAAKKLYSRNGFQELQQIALLSGTYKLTAMIRHPKTLSAT